MKELSKTKISQDENSDPNTPKTQKNKANDDLQ